MLIEFSLSNFRSFAAEQTLSLVASRLRDNRAGRIFRVDPPHKIEVVNSAIILGKNGSGKSTIVDAMDFVSRFVRDSSSARQEGEKIPFSPNLLDTDFRGKETHFRVIFSVAEKVYQFEFGFNDDEIVRESLYVADRTVRFRKIYERNIEGKGYSTSEELKGEKEVWKSSTRKNSLFISTAVQLNAESLKEPFMWLTESLHTIEADSNPRVGYTANECLNSENKAKVISFMKNFDIDIEDIVVVEEDVDDDAMLKVFNQEFIQNVFRKEIKEKLKRLKVQFIHRDSGGDKVPFELSWESSGTRSLFSLAGPILDTLDKGYCLVIDEINTTIHPLVLKALVGIFSNDSINTNRSQLIFTSHDTNLLRDDFLGRDQVWFVDKDSLGRSRIIPLSDYSPRKGEAVDRGYLTGRYGGVPLISGFLES